MKNNTNILLLFTFFGGLLNAQVWQWRVPLEGLIFKETNTAPEAFLWIPENCKYVKGVVFTQNNMIEEGLVKHEYFRKKRQKLGLKQFG